jgi:peptidoglycan hydrolase CwlO-like protein
VRSAALTVTCGALVLAFSLPARAQETGPDSSRAEAVAPGGSEVLFPRTALEQEIREKEDELEHLRQDLQDKRRRAAEIAGREHDLLSDIERINEEMEVNRQLLSKLGEKKSVLLSDLGATRLELRAAEERLSTAQDLLQKRLRAIYKFGRVEVMEVILLSRTFADLAKRAYYLSVVADHDLELISAFAERVETRRVLL